MANNRGNSSFCSIVFQNWRYSQIHTGAAFYAWRGAGHQLAYFPSRYWVYSFADHQEANTSIVSHGSPSFESPWSVSSSKASHITHLTIYLDYRPTHSSPALMPPLDDPNWIVRKFVKIHETSFSKRIQRSMITTRIQVHWQGFWIDMVMRK